MYYNFYILILITMLIIIYILIILYIYRFITLEHEISCLDICSFNNEFGKTMNLVAVGLWMDISVKILQLPDFVELVREPLGEGNCIFLLFPLDFKSILIVLK